MTVYSARRKSFFEEIWKICWQAGGASVKASIAPSERGSQSRLSGSAAGSYQPGLFERFSKKFEKNKKKTWRTGKDRISSLLAATKRRGSNPENVFIDKWIASGKK